MKSESDILAKRLLLSHLALVKGRHIQYLVKVFHNGYLAVSAWTRQPIWNHIVILPSYDVLDSNWINTGERICSLAGRNTCFYIVDHNKYKREITQLFDQDYYLNSQEYWLYRNLRPDSFKSVPIHHQILELKSSSIDEIHKFINAFSRGFDGLPSEYRYQLFLSLVTNSTTRNSGAIHSYAMVNNKIVGVGSCYYKSGIASIYNLCVVPECRNRGIGTDIINFLVNRAALMTCQTVFLQCDQSSLSFYSKLSFDLAFKANVVLKSKEELKISTDQS